MPAATLDPMRPPRPDDDRPHYLTLRDQLGEAIATGQLAPGTRLPSERQLQGETATARGTIREALFQLEAEGRIYRRDRSGWYVSPAAVTYDPTRWAGFMTYVIEQGRTPATQTLSIDSVAATAATAGIFGLAIGAPLHELTRRRSIDGRPVLVERIMVDPALAPDLATQDLDGSLTHILSRHYGLAVVRNHIDMRPCALTTPVAGTLGVKSGTPGLLIVRTSFAANGRVVEYDHEYWRHDAIKVQVDLTIRA